MTPSPRPLSFVAPGHHQPEPTSAPASTIIEMPRTMDQLAGDLSRQHLEHLDYLERMDQMWHLGGHLGSPRTRAGPSNQVTDSAAMGTDVLGPPMVDEEDDNTDDLSLVIGSGHDFALRPPSPDPDAMDLIPLDAAAALLRLPSARTASAYTAARDASTTTPPTPPLLPLSSAALAHPHLAPQHRQVPSSSYDLHGWLASAASDEDPHQNQFQLQLEDARAMAMSFQARRHYYHSLNRLSRQQQQQPQQQQQQQPPMASSTTSAGTMTSPTTALAGPIVSAEQSSDATTITPITPASLPTEPPLPAWVGAGPLRYRLSAEVAMHCPNLVHSKPRMRRRKTTTTASSARDASSTAGGGTKGRVIGKDKEKTHREHRSSMAAAATAASVAVARQAAADEYFEYRRQARAVQKAAAQRAAAEQAAAEEEAEAEAIQAEKAEEERREREKTRKGQNDAEVAGQATGGTEESLPERRNLQDVLPDDYGGPDEVPGP